MLPQCHACQIMPLMTAVSTGFFLLTGLPLVLLVHSIKFLHEALSKGLGPSSGTKEWNHFSAAWTKTIAAGDLSCFTKMLQQQHSGFSNCGASDDSESNKRSYTYDAIPAGSIIVRNYTDLPRSK